jgi:hypothetical protein
MSFLIYIVLAFAILLLALIVAVGAGMARAIARGAEIDIPDGFDGEVCDHEECSNE